MLMCAVTTTRLVQEAEDFAEEDKKAKATVAEKNALENGKCVCV